MPDLNTSETAKDEIRQRVASLNSKIDERRERAKQCREDAGTADMDAERMIRLRDQYEALLFAT